DPRNKSALALTDCGLYTIRKETLQHQVEQLDPVMRGVFRVMVLTVRDFQTQRQQWLDQLHGLAMQIGQTKIKSMVIEIVDSPHLPKDLQGDFLIAGYFARNIARLRPETDGAGHRLATQEPLLTSSHSAFRPVDLSVGPEGALYIADWFNPIIGHYQASLRHPDRDTTHGRIWRITAKDNSLLPSSKLGEKSIGELAEALASPLRRTRSLAKLRLMGMPRTEVINAMESWLESLDSEDLHYERHLYEAIGVFESHEVVKAELLDRLLGASEERARAYATRVAGRWHDRLEDPLKRLRAMAKDPSPRVRLETVVAVSDVPRAESVAIAALAADGVTGKEDRFLEYALIQATHALARYWKPAVKRGATVFEKEEHLTKILTIDASDEMMGVVRERLDDPAMLRVLARLGTTADAARLLEVAKEDLAVWQGLTEAAIERKVNAPANAEERLVEVLSQGEQGVRMQACRLSAAWRLSSLSEKIREMAENPSAGREAVAAVEALRVLDGQGSKDLFLRFAAEEENLVLAGAAVRALGAIDLPAAARAALPLIDPFLRAEISLTDLLEGVLQREGGGKALAQAVDESGLSQESAEHVRQWIQTTGRSEEGLMVSLGKRMGVAAMRYDYDPSLVQILVSEAVARGDAKRGKEVFQRPMLSCLACHEVDGLQGTVGAMKGPNLSAVAAGLPVDLLVESILWPARQIKEGYQASTLVTKDGQVISGFDDGYRQGFYHVRNLATGEVTRIRRGEVKSETKTGSMMPAGLTASLDRQELRDLIKYLTTLKGL
ncbi:MAG: hypothetical protein AAF191_12670, partial [Verrucomicrobiota bacterium]